MTKDEALERLVEHTKPKFDKDATLYRCRFCHSFDAESFDIQHKEDCPYHQARLALTRTALSEPDAKEAECERLREGLKTASNILDDCGRRLAELGDKSAAHIAREHGDDARALLNEEQAVSGGE